MIFYICARMCVCAKSLQSCQILCDPMDCSPLDSSVHGISQARILEWVAFPSFPSQGLNLCLLHWQVGSLPLGPPTNIYVCTHTPLRFYCGLSQDTEYSSLCCRASLVAQTVKHLPAMCETRLWSLDGEDPLEKEMATHSSTLAWRISMEWGSW